MILQFLLAPLGVDLFCFNKKFLVFNLVSRNLKVKYQRSWLGIFWTLASPLSMSCIYYFVFKVILQLQQPYYLAMLISGTLAWTFFSQSLSEGTESIVGSWGLLTKIPIPLTIFPFVGTLTNFITLLLSCPILLGAALISRCPVGFSLVLIPFLYLALFFIAYSLSYILAVCFVFLRDLRHVIGIALQIWFYGTPVIYQTSMIPAKYHWILVLNPIGQIFAVLQRIITEGGWPTFLETATIFGWVSFLIFLVSFLHRYAFKEIVERI